MTSVLDRAPERPLADQFVGRTYLRLVVVLGALMAIGPLTIDTYLPTLPSLSTELGATDAEAQLTITGLLTGLGLGAADHRTVVRRRRPPQTVAAGTCGARPRLSVVCAGFPRPACSSPPVSAKACAVLR
jgi:MFS family permease